VTTAADAARPAAQQAQAKVVEDALGAGALALDHWETALGKAELLHSRGITNTGALIGAQGDMVQARNRAIKARQQALDAVNDFITGINDRVTATGVGDQRGKRAYDAYQCTIARFDAIEARHTPAFERLTRHIGKLMGM
jgi:hypothetical protein